MIRRMTAICVVAMLTLGCRGANENPTKAEGGADSAPAAPSLAKFNLISDTSMRSSTDEEPTPTDVESAAPSEPGVSVDFCRLPGEMPPVVFEDNPLRLTSSEIADLLGNQDHLLTSYELNIVAALDAMPENARCWLGVDSNSSWLVGKTEFDLLKDERSWTLVYGLDCGSGEDGQAEQLRPFFHSPLVDSAIALSHLPDGSWALGRDVVRLDGRTTGLRVKAPGLPWKIEVDLDASARRAKLMQEAKRGKRSGRKCQRSAEAFANRIDAAIAQGKCPTRELKAFEVLNSPPYEDESLPCPVWGNVAYLVNTLIRCPPSKDVSELRDLLSLHRDLQIKPWLSVGVGLKNGPGFTLMEDNVRILGLLQALSELTPMREGEWRKLLSLLLEVPLGLAKQDLDRALDKAKAELSAARPNGSVEIYPSLAIYLLNRDGPTGLKGYRIAPRWLKDLWSGDRRDLRRSYSEACAELIEHAAQAPPEAPR